MPKCNGATLRVHFFHWNSALLDTVCSLTSKGFVEFVDTDVVDCKAVFVEELWDGDAWTDAHNVWGAAADGEIDKARDDWEVVALGCLATCKENSSGTITDLRAIPGGRRSTWLERRLQLPKPSNIRPFSRALIGTNCHSLFVPVLILDIGRDRDNLVSEESIRLGSQCLVVRRSGE
jgi:hypothetical protein